MLQQSFADHCTPQYAGQRSERHRQPRCTDTEQHATLSMLPLETLVQHCLTESHNFSHDRPYDDAFAYELFYRALAMRNEPAWEHLYTVYHALVRRWILDSSAFHTSGEHCDYFVNAAFMRFWQAIPPERFAAFATTAALLRYLRRCAQCAVIDASRASEPIEPLDEQLVSEWEAPYSLEHETLANIERDSIWQIVAHEVQTEAERVVLEASFTLGMKPGAIAVTYPALFPDVISVYRVKRNVLDRLARCQEMAQFRSN